jgi:hypothetical protein
MHEAYFKSGLKSEYINTMGALGDCLNIRNLFAHCSWGQSKKQGLFFVNLEERAKKKGQLRFRFRHASSKTLRELEDYFWLTFQWLDYFSNEFCSRNALMLNHSFSIPQKIPVMKPYMNDVSTQASSLNTPNTRAPLSTAVLGNADSLSSISNKNSVSGAPASALAKTGLPLHVAVCGVNDIFPK